MALNTRIRIVDPSNGIELLSQLLSQLATSANTRSGEPDPFSIFSGGVMS
ncbi:MAG: hypothetical protein QOD56_1275, partial [Gammaproteobacteria bacterium]|nr:hypothetical protein [Gammaproteobacteria bacterium]